MVADELKLILRADTAKAVRAMKRAQSQTDNTHVSMKKLVGQLAKSAAGWGAAVLSIRAFINAGKESVRLYREQEQAERKLATAVNNNPLLDGGAAARLQAFASELQGVTTVGDEVTLSLSAMLAASGRTEEQIKRIITVAADAAPALGITMESAVRNLNKTFGGLSGELGEVVPEIRNLSKEQLEAGEAVDMLDRKFRGMAETVAQTESGALEQFTNALGDMKETGGSMIVGFLEPAIRNLTDYITRINDTIRAKQVLNQLEGVNTEDALERQIQAREHLLDQAEEEFQAKAKIAEETERQIERDREMGARPVDIRMRQDALEVHAEARKEAWQRVTAERLAVRSLRQQLQTLREANSEREDMRTGLSDLGGDGGGGEPTGGGQGGAGEGPDTDRLRAENALRLMAESRIYMLREMNLAKAEQEIEKQREIRRQQEAAAEAMRQMLITVASSLQSGVFSLWEMAIEQENQRHKTVINNLREELEAMRQKHESQMEFAEQTGASQEEIAKMERQQAEAEREKEREIQAAEKKAAKDAFEAQKKYKTAQTIANTAEAVMRTYAQFGWPLGIIPAATVAGIGAAQVAMIQKQKFPGYARGGEFVTNGPQAIVVGDNPGGRERVRIDPMPDNRSSGGTIQVVINGAIGDRETVAVWVDEGIRRAKKRGAISS